MEQARLKQREGGVSGASERRGGYSVLYCSVKDSSLLPSGRRSSVVLRFARTALPRSLRPEGEAQAEW